jgi:hypothetical protein
MTIAIIVLLTIWIIMILWNVVPSFRQAAKGWSTIIEGSVITAVYYLDFGAQALKDIADWGYLPENWATYTPAVLFVWQGGRQPHQSGNTTNAGISFDHMGQIGSFKRGCGRFFRLWGISGRKMEQRSHSTGCGQGNGGAIEGKGSDQ